MNRKLKILHIEDLPSDAELVDRALKKGKVEYERLVVDNKGDFENALEKFLPDIILSDHTLPSFDSFEALKIVKARGIKIPFILVTGTVSEEFAVEVMKSGADDYILKDRTHRLPAAIENTLKKYSLESDRKKSEEEKKKLLNVLQKSVNEIYMINPDTLIFEYVNDGALKNLGYTNEEILTMTPLDLNPELEEKSFRDLLASIEHSESKKRVFDSLQWRKNKTHYNIEVHIQFIEQESGRTIFAIILDTTQRKKDENSLRASEENKRLVLNSALDAIISMDSSGAITFWNPQAQKIFGWAEEEVKGKQLFETIIPYEHREDHQLAMKGYLQTGKGPILNKLIEITALNRDHHKFPVELSIIPIEQEEIKSFYAFIRDITQRKENEETLQKSFAEIRSASERQSSIINSLNAHIALLDEAGKIVEVNEAWQHFEDQSQLISGNYRVGDNYIDLVENATGEDESPGIAIAGAIKDVLAGRKNEFAIEYPCHVLSEREWFSANVTPLYKNRHGGVVISYTNITGRKLAEETLRKSEANLNTIFDNGDTAYVLIDTGLKLVSYNHLAQKFAQEKYHTALRVGKYAIECFEEKGQSFVKEILQKVLKGETVNYETRDSQPSQWAKWYSIRHFPVINDEKKIFGIIMAVSDITERKQSESETSNLVESLHSKNKDLRQFAYIVSHNLRSPIAKILGLASLFDSDPGDTKFNQELLVNIVDEANNLDNVVKDINTIISARDAENERREYISFETEFQLIEQVLESQIVESHAVITTDFKNPAGIEAGKSNIYSMMYNLVSNAIKYRSSMAPLMIHLQTQQDDKFICLSVKDNGMGIDLEKNKEKIFGLYRRFHGDKISGKGIGLNLVKTQAESLGGRVEVESKVNQGSTFKIFLPQNHNHHATS